MPTATKPGTSPSWNAGTEPPAGKKTTGWVAGEMGPAEWFNWLISEIHQWLFYLRDLEANQLTWTGAVQTFNGIVAAALYATTATVGALTIGVPVGSPSGAIGTLNTYLLKWVGVGTGATGGNPPIATAIANELRPKNIPKAWGVVEYTGSGAIDSTCLKDGFNISGISDATNVLQISLASAMASGNYAVVVTSDTPAAQGAILRATGREAGHFHLAWETPATAPINLATPWKFSFVVFGVQTT